jgi:hypothetical protein
MGRGTGSPDDAHLPPKGRPPVHRRPERSMGLRIVGLVLGILFCIAAYGTLVLGSLALCEWLGLFRWADLPTIAKYWFVFATIMIVGSFGMLVILALMPNDDTES